MVRVHADGAAVRLIAAANLAYWGGGGTPRSRSAWAGDCECTLYNAHREGLTIEDYSCDFESLRGGLFLLVQIPHSQCQTSVVRHRVRETVISQ